MLIYVFGRSVEKKIKKWQILSFQSEKIIKAKVINLGNEKFPDLPVFEFLPKFISVSSAISFDPLAVSPVSQFLLYRSK